MLSSASSTAIRARRRRWSHETPSSWSRRNCPRFSSGDSRRSIPRACRWRQFRWHAHKPFYVLRLSVIEPPTLAGQSIVGRLYCTQKAMWKLGWFLRDFLYDPELLAHEQVDEKALPGLRGVVKISHTVINGISLINLDGFAPASQWEELSAAPVSSASRSNAEEATR